jgi:hypothetical protein
MTRRHGPASAWVVALAMTIARVACADDGDASLPPPPSGATREHQVAPAPALRASDDASLATTTRVPYAPESLAPATPPARSAAVDRASAAGLARRDDVPTFSLFVEAPRGARPAQPLSLEQRFAATLSRGSPTLASRLAGNSLDTEPCPKLASPGTPFGPAYNPFGFCP